MISSIRQAAALAALAAALLHLCIGLKLAIFHAAADGGQVTLVAPVLLFGIILWGTGCRLASFGSSADTFKRGGEVVDFPLPIKAETSEACSGKVAA